jgi:NAD(P)-dependent dehydrogenase (short-subunit alcohol dehydrogenase family)
VRKQEDIESLLAEAGTRRVVGYVEPIILDVTDAGQIAAAVEIVRVRIAAGGRLHAIINNAGAQWAGPIETMPLTEWRSQFDVTFFGPIALTQQLLPQLRASRGRVINVTSIDELNRLADALPKSLQPVYADALRAFAKTVTSAQRFSTSPAKASLTFAAHNQCAMLSASGVRIAPKAHPRNSENHCPLHIGAELPGRRSLVPLAIAASEIPSLLAPMGWARPRRGRRGRLVSIGHR